MNSRPHRARPWLLLFALCPLALPAHPPDPEDSKDDSPTAAEIVRKVLAREAWIRTVDSCQITQRIIQSEIPGRGSTPAPTPEELETLDRSGKWEASPPSTLEVRWTLARVKARQRDPSRGREFSSSWDGQTMIVHDRSSREAEPSFGLYDESRRHLLISRRLNLWSHGGLYTRGSNAWWSPGDPEQFRKANHLSPDTFRLLGETSVDGHPCHVLESRAGMTRLHVDRADFRLRTIIQYILPNGLPADRHLEAMRSIADVEMPSTRHWRPWTETLSPERRLEVSRKLSEKMFAHARIRAIIRPRRHVEVVPGGWLPLAYTRTSSYPDWDGIQNEGRHEYRVSRLEAEVTNWKVGESIPETDLVVQIPEGGKVFDWRFDPPFDYPYRADRTEEEIRALAEVARLEREKQRAPLEKLRARIEERVGQDAPEFPGKGWVSGSPLTLAKLRGKAVILHFWATWCGPCHDDIRFLNTLGQSADSDPLVIGVHDAQADRKLVLEDIEKRGIRYPILIDSKGPGQDDTSLRAWYRIFGLPHAILIDPRGRVAAQGSLSKMLEKARELP